MGNEDGTFQGGGNLSLTTPQSVAAGDFNGDGRPDLAIANVNANVVSVLMGACWDHPRGTQ